MRVKALALVFLLAMTVSLAAQQPPANSPVQSDVYCSGLPTVEKMPGDTYVISGEESSIKTTFTQGDLVYVNKGSAQGVKVGDEFQVIRALHDPSATDLFAWQQILSVGMGKLYADVGRLKVVHTEPNVSTAEIVVSCDFMQRGDLAMRFTERTIPAFKQEKFDRFAPVNGKPLAMVVHFKGYGMAGGIYSVAYVNLGTSKGVRVGSYFRIFRYQGQHDDAVYVPYEHAYAAEGYGKTPRFYQWNDLPREVVGEGIVLRVSPNAAAVLITYSVRAVYAGDYVELQ